MILFWVGRIWDIVMQREISIARLRPPLCINIWMGSGSGAYSRTWATSWLGLNMIDPFHDIGIVSTLVAY
jgi:hypothetical protein